METRSDLLKEQCAALKDSEQEDGIRVTCCVKDGSGRTLSEGGRRMGNLGWPWVHSSHTYSCHACEDAGGQGRGPGWTLI